MQRPDNQVVGTLLLALAVLALAAWVLAPGLGGAYAFDDVPNLSVLGQYGRVDNLHTLLLYLTSGQADPGGRPLSLLTFLVDARDWPAPPLPFKRTNLILHLGNGVLLGFALRAMASRSGIPGPRASRAAVIAAGIWLLHPLLVSTTLYVVQREAMLPATFFLLTLLGWIKSRDLMLAGRIREGWLLGATSVLVGTLLATASKLNGLLVPLLLLVCDTVLLGATRKQETANDPGTALARMRMLLLVVPSLLLVALLIAQIPTAAGHAERGRDWSLGQRFLSQPRALFHYLGLLWIPQVYSDGLFNDQMAASRGLLQPATTLFAIVGLVALAASAILARRRFPAWSAAILFFLAGHLIEAGPVALELYFEHRNYLPAMLMFWPLALWLTSSGTRPWLRRVLVPTILLGLALMTHRAASLWGDPAAQAMVWAAKNPGSARAQAFAAQWELAYGDKQGAERRLRKALIANPRNPLLALNLLGTTCQGRGLQAEDVSRAVAVVATEADRQDLAIKWLQQGTNMLASGRCRGLTRATLDQLLDAFASNPRTALDSRRQSGVWHVRGLLHLQDHDPAAAEAAFEKSVTIDPEPLNLLIQSGLLRSHDGVVEASRHLARLQHLPTKPWHRLRSMQDLHAWILWRQGYWQKEAARLERAFAATPDLPRK